MKRHNYSLGALLLASTALATHEAAAQPAAPPITSHVFLNAVVASTGTVDMSQISGGSPNLAFSTVAGLQVQENVLGPNIPQGATINQIYGGQQITLTATASFSAGQNTIAVNSNVNADAGVQCIDQTAPGAIANGTTIIGNPNNVLTLSANALTNSAGTADIIVCDPVVRLSVTPSATLAIGTTVSFKHYTNVGDLSSGGVVNTTGSIAIGGTATIGALFPGNQGGAIFVAGPNAGAGIQPSSILTTAIGTGAGGSQNTGLVGSEDTFVGWHAGGAMTTGGGNTSVGVNALGSAYYTVNNVAVGTDAMRNLLNGVSSVAVGRDADRNSNNGPQTAIGYGALNGIEGAVGSSTSVGVDNIAVGFKAMYGTAWTSGSLDIAVGDLSLVNVTTGSNNVAIGPGVANPGTNTPILGALNALTTGSNNIGIGINALSSITTTNNNIAIGSNAIASATGGASNIVIGANSYNGASTANNNVIIGVNAATLDTGAGNVMIGTNAGSKGTSGSNNVLIGNNVASVTLTTGQANILIGNGQDVTSAGVSNQIDIGGVFFMTNNSTGVPSVGAVCGTGGTVDAHANNHTGQIQVGSGVIAGCTLTFAGTGFGVWNHCIVSSETAETSFGYSFSLTAITLSATSLTSDKVDYSCEGL